MRKIASKIFLFVIVVITVVNSTFAGATQRNTPVYNSNVKESKKIALTFDDGPHPRNTEKILEILNDYGIKATFFVIGVNVKNYPETFKLIVNEGHEVGNHTYSHKALKNVSKDEILEEIKKTENEIMKHSSAELGLVRPPCGMYDEKLVEIALENQYKIVLWNIDTKDWEHKASASIENNVISKVKGGDIILFHDYISGANNTPAALKQIIPKLLEEGYTFVTVGELLQNI